MKIQNTTTGYFFNVSDDEAKRILKNFDNFKIAENTKKAKELKEEITEKPEKQSTIADKVMGNK